MKNICLVKEEYRAKAEGFMDYLLGLPTTGGGLVWIGSSEWGSLRYAGNFAMFAMQVTSHINIASTSLHSQAGFLGIKPEQSFKFAEQQMNYALGDAGHSYVCGFGSNPPQRPHHRYEDKF